MTRRDKIKIGLILITFLIFVGVEVYIFHISENKVGEPEQAEEVMPLPDPEQLREDSLYQQFYLTYTQASEDKDKDEFMKARDLGENFLSEFPASDRRDGVQFYLDEIERWLAENDRPKSQPRLAQSLSKPKPAATQPVVRQTPPPARKEPTRLQGDLQIVERINANKIELDQSLRRMRQVRDEANRVTFYFNKNISHYVYKNSLEIYIIDHDDRPPLLRMRIYYHDTDWLNIRGYEVYADDREYAIPVAPEWIERGRGSGGAWEWCDIPVTASELIAINAVKDASWNAVRYIGERRVFERTMTEDEKLRLAYVLRAYRALEQRESLLLTESR